MKLYDLEPSGNCYRVRLLCALMGVPLELRAVDFINGEHKSAAFLKMNPLGELPILEDDGFIVRDSHAILVYIASKFNAEQFFPSNAKDRALVMQWLSTSVNNIQHGPADARLIDKFGYALNREVAHKQSAHILGVMEAHLQNRDWLELNRCTLADVACFPYISVAHEGGIDITTCPNVLRWVRNVQKLPNFVAISNQI